MPGLIQKSGYIKPGNGGSHYAEYIATREGVELIEAPPPSHDGGGYLEYMAQRPRSHGLFSADGPADLEKTMEEINGHTGPVWTFVYSLKREDAHRLGYENGESWRRLLLAHQAELATAMKIPPSNFRWCAAFHDEKHHPHIHMMVWSADPKQGFLTEKGIEKMRSQLSNEIFRDELLSLYQQKDLSYSQVRDAATEAMGRLIREMETGLCHSSIIMEQMETLAGMLECHKGKKVYGYLKKPVKAQVDAIVDELAKIPEVAQCYEQWNQLRDELERYYKDSPREYLPLSQQEEFKAIKNMVIREAERLRLGTFTFEDASMKDEVDEDQDCVLLTKEAAHMRDTLENLYFGNITPNDQIVKSGTALKKAMEQSAECEEKLTALLEDKEKALLLRLINAENEIGSTMALENFILGFRLGVRMILEALDEDDGSLIDPNKEG